MTGRPREFDRSEVLEKIQHVFWERGYESTSMSDLVAATGLASARLYAAYGSKEALFREAIERYEQEEGGFAERALAEEPTARRAIERILREAVDVYTQDGARGCMVVSSATNCSPANDAVRQWLAGHRRGRTDSLVERLRAAVAMGELPEATDAQALGDAYAAVLHGISVQARDGIPRDRLLALIDPAMSLISRHGAAN
ncbi:TetR/AcrR family transcriptional regulator [Mycobacterium sp. CBMA293]|uniref:TetR/AcrR family transcriptional regulator n=1 Tax=unclassified Mycolicibacterium TaxID=2636767 RepID=UPI0012DF38D3|nr:MULTISPECIES: TetR/AcrR family transcriptional regulator [unclassified Mycolicibacterium]MUL49012.1 TetR/AcrR family transcriptional regulator [Mycolicibacterium sp. CBMA 360]MUL58573.1 TetR/AcrR family transcriptional regulator [Mycolicibacterium sp. CBMA 335]MUL62972.1 TetR family transcriptional regulator [Mycolicibacterium sp. CBMA 234]MUL74031.1 TetR/AcrR family transcriptional regulator [Mycolicibacterium sp. CBMA 311]MUL93456.1 TetR/AcrR family transcriptional regulator [Mycolicibact